MSRPRPLREHLLLLLTLLAVPACLACVPRLALADPPLAAGNSVFAAPLAAEVYATALAFMAPRTLDPVGIPQLTMWGLHGLTALDQALVPELRNGSLRLLAPGRVLYATAPPPVDDAAGWARAAAGMADAAWPVSAPLRRAGTQGIVHAFFDEVFNHLDPYSRYEPPARADDDRDRRDGQAGAGMTVVRRGKAIVVRSVVEDGPATDAGILPGDQLLVVDGQSTRGRDAATVSDWLAGPDQTTVELSVRGRDGRVRDLEVTRAQIPPETVFSSRQGDVLVLTVTGFADNTDERLEREVIRGLQGARRPRGVVVDLRGNRGGVLRAAVRAAAALIPSGLIATTAGRDPQATHIWEALGEDAAEGLPVVVVVDGRSASAAEIFAAAIADERRGVVLGSSTLGKGLVQTIAQLPDGGELFVTWSRVLAPRGWPLQGLGVLPQLCTSLGREATEQQLEDLASGSQELAAALAQHEAARAPIPPAQILAIRSACPAAEGQASDLDVARRLIAAPEAYQTALLPPIAGQATASQ